MSVTGRERGAVAVLIGGQDFRTYTVEWDDAILDLVAEEREFWEDHVVPRIPPPWDGTAAATRYLRSQYPVEDESEWVALPEQYGLLTDFVEARHRKEMWAVQEERLQQAIMDAMGPARKLLSPMVRITYATPADAVQTDWKGYATHLAGLLGESDDIETIRGLYTSPKPGKRSFRVYVPQLQLEEK
jgi:hypothetical protein